VAGSPACFGRGGIVVVTGHDHVHEAACLDADSFSPWSVVMPPFFEDSASAPKRARVEKGTMHPKLTILEACARHARKKDARATSHQHQQHKQHNNTTSTNNQQRNHNQQHTNSNFNITKNKRTSLPSMQFDGGCVTSRFLRVIIASDNLGSYEGKLNNNFWVHNFPLRTTSRCAAAAPAAAPAAPADAAGSGGACPSSAAAPSLLPGPPAPAFGTDLIGFVCAMLRLAPELSSTWAARLDRYNSSLRLASTSLRACPAAQRHTTLPTAARLSRGA
jgi:hypothetical protein